MLTDLKAQAEALVLSSNDNDGLLTCVIRGCNVFGPGDKYLVPSLVHMAKTGWAKVWEPEPILLFFYYYCWMVDVKPDGFVAQVNL